MFLDERYTEESSSCVRRFRKKKKLYVHSNEPRGMYVSALTVLCLTHAFHRSIYMATPYEAFCCIRGGVLRPHFISRDDDGA